MTRVSFKAIDIVSGNIIEYPLNKELPFRYDFLFKGNDNENVYLNSTNELSKITHDFKDEARKGWFIYDHHENKIIDSSKDIIIQR